MADTVVEVRDPTNFTPPLKEDVLKRIAADCYDDVTKELNQTSTTAKTMTEPGVAEEVAEEFAEYTEMIQKLGEELKIRLDSDESTKHETEQWLIIVGPCFYITWIPYKDAPKCALVINDKIHIYLTRF